ncbi:hypothetical protein SKAU_G00387550 [Synaphobranchus kaupii]|uniref:Uncharacterized protein n=1 Tax=Synaphobranchus kaupii TaxID=118154 RepID=A0A9Q1IBA4_SYNKA|nr:hypothetical protein SKAU_G00387550 [Synaphobranchus kaupii]
MVQQVFCPGRHHRPALGFLEECLRKRRKRMPDRNGPYARGPATARGAATAIIVARSESDTSVERALEMKEWLKNNIWPQDQVSEYMADTAIHRAQWIRGDGTKSLPEILAEYSRFLDTPGMILQDFHMLYPASSEKLTANWVQTFSAKVLQFAKKERNTQSLLSELDEGATADTKGDMALRVLPLLLPAPAFKVAKKTVRPSIDETQRAFINMQPAGTNMPEFLRQSQAQPQPFIAMIGAQAFTIIEGEAVCFK